MAEDFDLQSQLEGIFGEKPILAPKSFGLGRPEPTIPVSRETGQERVDPSLLTGSLPGFTFSGQTAIDRAEASRRVQAKKIQPELVKAFEEIGIKLDRKKSYTQEDLNDFINVAKVKVDMGKTKGGSSKLSDELKNIQQRVASRIGSEISKFDLDSMDQKTHGLFINKIKKEEIRNSMGALPQLAGILQEQLNTISEEEAKLNAPPLEQPGFFERMATTRSVLSPAQQAATQVPVAPTGAAPAPVTPTAPAVTAPQRPLPPNGMVRVQRPDGKIGLIPQADLAGELASGSKMIP